MEPTTQLTEVPAMRSRVAAPDDERKVDLVWSYTFSYLLGAALLVLLIWSSGVWNFLANVIWTWA